MIEFSEKKERNISDSKIYLAVNNYFASKRWTRPSEWLKIVKDLGLNYVEASADNECDPLYSTPEYIQNWIREVKEYSCKTRVKVANLYSGHGTYTTLGISHTDYSVRKYLLDNWLKEMLKIANELDAGLGFFCHAFPDSVLQDTAKYEQAEDELISSLSELAMSKREGNNNYLGIEQMYSPHQFPWTVKGATRLLKKVKAVSQKDFYITIDTGHQTGQQKFVRPTTNRLIELLQIYKNGGRVNNLWLGSKTAYELFYTGVEGKSHEGALIKSIEQEMDRFPHLFANADDGNLYFWLENLACYSPIIHLQQTTGNSSSHLPFISDFNDKGIIAGEKVLKSILKSYEQAEATGMPARCSKIYLTLEIFSGTADINVDILFNLKESVKYWRQFIPEDGLSLCELVKQIPRG
jgi:sugar phosphate isomerase/epimerase